MMVYFRVSVVYTRYKSNSWPSRDKLITTTTVAGSRQVLITDSPRNMGENKAHPFLPISSLKTAPELCLMATNCLEFRSNWK